jgi:hypothetical protein
MTTSVITKVFLLIIGYSNGFLSFSRKVSIYVLLVRYSQGTLSNIIWEQADEKQCWSVVRVSLPVVHACS